MFCINKNNRCRYYCVLLEVMDFEKVKEKTFENAYKGNVDEVMKAVEEHLRLLKEVDVVSTYLFCVKFI